MPHTYKVFVSETINKIKPNNEFYEYILGNVNCKPEECLMIGDSIKNDIVGANSMGIDTCWFNPTNKVNKNNVCITFEIQNIKELLSLEL